MIRFACIVLAICASASGVQQETAVDAEREKDVYAIYSVMFTDTRTSHGADTNERYLIAATTATKWPMEPCVTPPDGRRAEFTEVLADFELRKSKPRQLIRALSTKKPYVLLDADEVKAFIDARSPVRPNAPPDERFRGAVDVFTLTDVFFNQARTLALSHISSWCGGLCGLWQWRVFEKSAAGKWEERPWIGCGTIAAAPSMDPQEGSVPTPGGRRTYMQFTLSCLRTPGPAMAAIPTSAT